VKKFAPVAARQRLERSESWQVVGVGPHDKLRKEEEAEWPSPTK
jgi:hypothetical protein